ncbi:MAG: glutamine synthetase type III [Clostridiaceae bacterium]|jgi:glutamine synthetase|nr:glutamine synthetase type III [Clostridiaceae bacterium]
MKDIPALFGSMVFNDKVMSERLPKDTYRSLKRTIETGKHLDLDVANEVANAMKNWALEKGATHFTHWFQPLTGVTAEKHDSFISPCSSGNIIMEFSGKELVRGEPDASSFPSGGLRTMFEARGYTAWDPTSYAFVKDNSLYIPTAFCSYSGDALDKKTPLLRSMEAIGKQALRILKLFGNEDVKSVITAVGAEQEYFLIDKDMFNKRSDLMYCGRTLFGAKPPKGQELEDHYYGAIKPRVASFMKDLEEELWKLGVMAKTKHNEVAPAQHELAPFYTTTNIATDHNQLIMELLKTVADRHNLTCLIHEKPFAGVNGSGKHNNWSLFTDTGVNLFEPGATPSQNAQFLLFLMAVIKAVDEYQDLLRISVASAGNDLRLGSGEAPPAIVSIFLGEELTEILDSIENGKFYKDRQEAQMEIGVSALPHFPRDNTDRNRTSPFAFTGNKFEFRMLGSALSIADPNVVINTIVADALSQFADILEASTNFKKDLNNLVRDVIKKHKRIIFNGNNYCDEWVKEAEKRGLLNLKSTPDAMPHFLSEKNIKLFAKFGVLSKAEICSRYEILLENYSKTIHIEALTMLEMVKKNVIPSVIRYEKDLADTLMKKKALSSSISCKLEENLISRIAELSDYLYERLNTLERNIESIDGINEHLEMARYYREYVLMSMQSLREVVDQLETLIGKYYWTVPAYGDLLYSV